MRLSALVKEAGRKSKVVDQGKPIDPEPGDGENSITPTPPGSGTELDPYVLTAKEVAFGGSVSSDETISFTNQKEGALVQFVDQNSSTNGARFTQPIGVIGADGTWSGKLLFTDTPESTDETGFAGLLKIGDSSIYYSWTVTVTSDVVIEKPEVLTPPTMDQALAVTRRTSPRPVQLPLVVLIVKAVTASNLNRGLFQALVGSMHSDD